MTPRARVLTALKRGQPDMVPWIENDIEEDMLVRVMGGRTDFTPGELCRTLGMDGFGYRTLIKNNWKTKNTQNSGLKFDLLNETKVGAGYTTRKAIAKTAEGRSFVVYYTTDLIPVNKEYDATFTSLPGLPIEYEVESGKTKFKYTLSRISYEPVLVSQFDFPTNGYRVMTYEENHQLKKGN